MKNYVKPEVEIVEFLVEEEITGSVDMGGNTTVSNPWSDFQ